VKATNTELNMSNRFSASQTATNENSVTAMINYVEKFENPFHVTDDPEARKLHNILTRAVMPDDVRHDLLAMKENGDNNYQKFRKERYIDKAVPLSSVIHRVNIKTFASVTHASRVTDKVKRDKKSISQGQKMIDLARVRGYDMKEVFKYDLVESSYLFDENGLMTPAHDKYLLGKELESNLKHEDMTLPYQWPEMESAYLIDVMSVLRKIRTKDLETFGEFCCSAMAIVTSLCKRASCIDFVFDSYLRESVKEGECSRRATVTPIEHSNLKFETRLEKDMSTFWPSGQNKEQLQILLAQWIKEKAPREWGDTEVIFSGMANGILHSSSLNADMPGLDGEWEEADVRLVPHAWHAGQEGNERLVILSPDNDVLAIFLYFCKELMELGVKEIWTRAGVGESTRYLPIHILASNIGEPLCHVLPALHALSGADCTSRFCTKHAALKAKPEQYLQDFGRREDDLCIEQAEEYLTKAWKHNTSCKTSDELRFSLYHHSNLTVDSLPPPSYALVGHIQRAFYSAFNQKIGRAHV
jgi:hypothetical protein